MNSHVTFSHMTFTISHVTMRKSSILFTSHTHYQQEEGYTLSNVVRVKFTMIYMHIRLNTATPLYNT